jgi:hypothetical protein
VRQQLLPLSLFGLENIIVLQIFGRFRAPTNSDEFIERKKHHFINFVSVLWVNNRSKK